MSDDFKILHAAEPSEAVSLSVDDTLSDLAVSRERIKTLCSIFISVSGVLFSVNGLILFFSLRDVQGLLKPLGASGSILTAVLLAAVIALSVRSIYPSISRGVLTKQQQLEFKLELYHRELTLMKKAYWCLMVSIAALIVQVVFLGIMHGH